MSKYKVYIYPRPYVYEDVEAKDEVEAREKGLIIADREYIEASMVDVEEQETSDVANGAI